MNKKFYITLILIFVLMGCASHQAQEEDLFIAVLDAGLKQTESSEYPTAFDKVFELVESDQADTQMLVNLLDYYLGEAAGEVLHATIVNKGESAIPVLRAKRERPIECLPQYKVLCTISREHRNEIIDRIIEMIQSGEKIVIPE